MTARARRGAGWAAGLAGLITAGLVVTPTLAGAQEMPFPERTLDAGSAFVMSGDGCLFEEKPGVVVVGLAWPLDEEGTEIGEMLLPTVSEADAKGEWSVANNLPDNPSSYLNIAVPVCVNPDNPDEAMALEDEIEIIYIRAKASTPPGTGAKPPKVTVPDPKDTTRAVTGKTKTDKPTTKAKGPKAVRTAPVYTG
jgi:hypothetical protein